MKKILVVFGTRPEAIKMCPLVNELKKRELLDVKVCVTGQHRQMLDQILKVFDLIPDYDFSIMQENQTLFDITTKVLIETKKVLEIEQPDIVLIHGDTTTAFATGLACFYLQIPIGHVEAGLRTYTIYSPFPEEFNRQMIRKISKLHFAPTKTAKDQLFKEGTAGSEIYITGNTAIDALKTTVKASYQHEVLNWVGEDRLIVLTVHRRENVGEPMKQIFRAVRRIVDEYPSVKVVYPIHLNPKIREIANKYFARVNRIKVLEPLSVIDFHNFLARSYLVLTDSGGIQEEASALGKPVLVLRDITERSEGVLAGTLKLVGTKEETIYRNFKILLENTEEYSTMSCAENPYGDGCTVKRIADILEKRLTEKNL